MKKIYYDTEFLEGKQSKRFLGLKIGETKPTIDLISIGMIDEEGNEYYAISKDFNLKEAWNRYDIVEREFEGYKSKNKVYWIRENVLKPIFIDLAGRYNSQILRVGLPFPLISIEKFSYKALKNLINQYGKTNEQIKEEIHDFCLDSLVEMMMGPCNKVQLYGYYSAYDHVCLCWLFGKMIDLPEGFPMYTIDLKQELDNLAESESVITGRSVSDCLEAIKSFKKYPKQENEHSAIHDARWNKKLHEFLNKL